MSAARLVEDLPFEDYLDHPALSASGMKHLLDSPARFRHERQEPSDSAAMRLGRYVHALAFEQDHDFIEKTWDARTTEGKKKAAEIAWAGLEVVSSDDWAIAQGISEAIRKNRGASEILFPPGVRHEVSCFWTDEETGVDLRCRFDALGPKKIGDLKSIVGAHPNSVAKSAASYGWLVSGAHYTAAARQLGLDLEFVLVACEKKPPYFVSLVGINEIDLELAERLRRKAIRLYADCLERDSWPDYSGEITYPEAPKWWRYAAEDATYDEMEIA